MIEIVIDPTGDSAEAETPEAAVFAACTMIDDARDAGDDRPCTATFVSPTGEVTRADVPEWVLRAAAKVTA